MSVTAFKMRYAGLPGFGLFLAIILMMTACEKDVAIPNANQDKELSPRGGVSTSASVQFGDEDAGSPFPPGSGHDQSFHGSDKMVPRTVVIAAGGEVHFDLVPFHQAAIYSPGTQPEDIDVSLLEDLTFPIFIPDFIINDPGNRVALSPDLSPVEFTWTTPEGTFDTPGRYLVICTTLPHFVQADMYGWVIVK